MIKAVLFDFWGTLVNHGNAPELVRFNQALQMDHRALFASKMDEVMQKPYSKEQALQHLREGIPLQEKEVQQIESFFSTRDVSLYPDVMDALKELKKMKVKMGLVSNTQSIGIKKELKDLGLEKYFSGYGLSFEVGVLKPDSRLFLHALKQLKVKPAEALMVGDSLGTDILGGKAAGLQTCLIDRLGRQAKVKECDFVVRKMTEIPAIVKKEKAKPTRKGVKGNGE